MKKSTLISKNIIFLLSIVSLIALIAFVGYEISISDRRIFPISLIALICGLLFESFRISTDWRTVVYVFISAFVLSFIAFLPKKQEYNYNFDNHMDVWPYYFLFLFVTVSAISYSEKIITRLTEGVTLIQSLSIIYWVLDYDFWNIDSTFIKILIIIVLIFSAFAVFNALTNFVLSRTTRFILSIWSSIIMLVFAIDYIYRVYQNQEIETTGYLSHAAYIGLQFFLLGVSSIYIVQNIIMLIGFLPSKNAFFNSRYINEFRELREEHIGRYSEQQVHVEHSIVCIVFVSAIYWINYKNNYLPRHLVVWLAFVLFPILIWLISIRRKQKFTNK